MTEGNLNDLGGEALNDGLDYGNLPDQGGAPRPFFQPGAYRFAFSPLTAANFKAVQSEKFGTRVNVRFDGNAPLVVRQSPKGEMDGMPYETSLSNVPRNRAKKGQPEQLASDLDYLNRALGVAARPASNAAYAQTLIDYSQPIPVEGGAPVAREFGADIEVSYSCNDKKDAYFAVSQVDDQGQPTGEVDYQRQPVDGAGAEGPFKQGCGTRIYQGKVTPENGRYPERVTCGGCGASLRGFGNLTRFRA